MNKEQKQFLLSSLFSGIMIGIGCTVYLSCVNKLVGALLFCAGLFFILTNGGTLFTGICGLKTPVKKLTWVFVLNGLGTVIPAIVSWSNVVDGATKLGATAAAVMLGKLSMNPVSWLLNGLMCGVLMYLAVIGYKKAKDSLHGIAAVLFAIVGFIVCGFEHSIADMGYLAIAIPNLSFWQILQCMGMILVIMLGNVFGGKADAHGAGGLAGEGRVRFSYKHAEVVCSCDQLNRAKGVKGGTSSLFVCPLQSPEAAPLVGSGAKPRKEVNYAGKVRAACAGKYRAAAGD